MRQPKKHALAPQISLQKLSQKSNSIANLIKLANSRVSLDDKLNQCLPDIYKHHFRVNSLSEGTLTLTCDSAKLMTRFRITQQDTISRLNKLISPQNIDTIKIKVRPASGFNTQKAHSETLTRNISKKNAQILLEEAEHTNDQSLKNILTNLAKHAD
ncbi:MAG: DciA family protein [Oleiphilus sp.]